MPKVWCWRCWAAVLLLALGGASAGGECAGERLYNGICLPKAWPPTYNLSSKPHTPPYLSPTCHPGGPGCQPEVIQVGGSRQLFVDDFLIEDTADLRRVFHQATVSPTPVLSPSKPWESASANPAVRSGLVRSQAAFAFSGGIWHDPSAPPDRRYRLYYECGINNAVCLAVSADGVAFSKPKLRPDGSNIVVDLPHDGSSVHLVLDEPDPSKRWKMTIAPVQFCHNVTVNGVNFTGQPVIPYLCDNSGSGCSVSGAGNGPGGGDCGCQHLKHSADGITWRTALNKTGSSGDRSTGFYNALRRKFVWSIRAS